MEGGMSYAFTRDVPVGEDHYAEVRAAIGAAVPEGLVVHLAVRHAGGLRYIDVWDSEAHWRRFHHERVAPAVRKVTAAHGMTRPATSAPYQPMEIIDMWVAAGAPREAGRDVPAAGPAPRLAGIHHLKVHVADVRRSALWYQRVLGYQPAMEFAEAGRLVGYGLGHPNGGTFLTLRLDPLHAAQTAGRVYFEMGALDKAALDELARRLDDLGEPHGPVLRTPVGWVLPDLHDPDGHEMRFYVTDDGAPTAGRPARMHDAGPRARIEQLDHLGLAPYA
jgi:catechol 2,3-dioxygenase-like lactoylglutathione lyase family enzyme